MMRKILLACAASLAFAASGAHAATATDATGDFIPSYTGPFESDLDVTSFSASFDPVHNLFDLSATLAGDIDPTLPGIYVIGANTGTGASSFASIGFPGVKFNQVMILQKNGTGVVGGHALTVHINGNEFNLEVPLAFLPSTGAAPIGYSFNLWPRNGSNQISDFAPNNSDLVAVPEPGVWAMMVMGVGLIGSSLRRRRAAQPSVA